MKSAADLLKADLARSERAAGSVAVSLVREAMGPAGTVQKAGGAPFPFDQPGLVGGTAPGAKLTQPYRQSAWIQTAIRTKTGEIGQAPVKFYEGDHEFNSTEFDKWWADKPFLGPGRKRLDVAEVRQQSSGWLNLAGERFIVLGDDWLVPFPSTRAASLSRPILARPDRMRHVVDGSELVGWEFTDGARRRHLLLPDQVLHRPLWNPYDDFRGLSPIEAIIDAAESDYLAGVYTRNLMRNNGDQGVYIIAKNGVPTDEQRAQIVRDLRAKRAAAQRGDFRPVFMTGDITVEDAKAAIPDAGMKDIRLLDRHTVYIGLGLPASMADVQASYSIGSDSDRFRLITGTCMGEARMVDSDFGVIASKFTGRTLTAEADWDEHPVIQQVRRERVDTLVKLTGVGMPVKDANQYLDMGMKPFPGWEKGYLPYSIVPVEQAENTPEKDPSLGEGGDDGEQLEPEQLAILLRGRRLRLKCRRAATPQLEPGHVCSCSPVMDLALLAKDRDPKELAQWSGYMRTRREHIAGYRTRFTRWLAGVRREILVKIDERFALEGKTVTKATATDFLFSVAESTAEFLASMRKQGSIAYNAAGQEVMKEIGRDDPFQFAPTKVLQFLKERDNKLKDVPQSVWERIQASLQEGIDAGEGQAELSARVRAECNEIDKGRSLVIAQTETGAAFGDGRHAAMKEAGVPLKAWLPSGNANMRPSHEQAGKDYAKGIPIDEPFMVGGYALQHPGDPSGPAKETINCHCVEIAKLAEPES